MYIKNIHLINFQRHSDLKINLTNTVNVIYGQSDIGKSCIRRALEWVCFNAKIDGIRKSGTKQTSVKIILDNNIAIERVRSASINRYIIHKDGEEVVFDSIGKTIPEEVKNVLKIEPINIDGEDIYLNSAPQLALPFLFDRSPTFRMKLFNQLTGNDILDKLFAQFNKDILHINREHKRESEHLEEQETNLAEIEVKKGKMEAAHECVTKSVQHLRQNNEKYSKLLELLELVTYNRVTIVETKRNISLIKIPDLSEIKGLRTKIDRLEQLKNVSMTSEQTEMGICKVRGQLKEVRLTTLNPEALYSKIERVDMLKKIQLDLDKTSDMCYTLNEKIKELNNNIKNKEIQDSKIREKLKICPTCGQEIKL